MKVAKNLLLTAFVFLFVNACATTELIRQEVVETYKKVARHYRDILEHFQAIEHATISEKEYFTKQLVKKIKTEVKAGNLPLYGNFLNRIWKQSRACSAEYPLRKFEETLLVDSIGHVSKAYNQLLAKHLEDKEIERFIAQLKNIGELVKKSQYYKIEKYKVDFFKEKQARQLAEQKVCQLESLLSRKRRKKQAKKKEPVCAYCKK